MVHGFSEKIRSLVTSSACVVLAGSPERGTGYLGAKRNSSSNIFAGDLLPFPSGRNSRIVVRRRMREARQGVVEGSGERRSRAAARLSRDWNVVGDRER